MTLSLTDFTRLLRPELDQRTLVRLSDGTLNAVPNDRYTRTDLGGDSGSQAIRAFLAAVRGEVSQRIGPEFQPDAEAIAALAFQDAGLDPRGDTSLAIGQIRAIVRFFEAQGVALPVDSKPPERSESPSDKLTPRYEYQDQDMSALGAAYRQRIDKLRTGPLDRRPPETHFLNPISNLEQRDTSHANPLAETLGERFNEYFQKQPPEPLQLAIPYNTGNSHWTGILIKIVPPDPGSLDGKHKVTIEYMNPLRDGTKTLPDSARHAIMQALEPFKTHCRQPRFETVDPPFVQPDNTSCGPCTMENLLHRAAGMPDPPEDERSDMMALRRRQIAFLPGH